MDRGTTYESSLIITHSAPDGGAHGGRPELADVARLGRRALRGLVRAARADLVPSLGRTLGSTSGH